jgi:hypothetical protein
MNIIDVMKGLNFTSALKEKLIRMWVPEKEMAWVDFNSMDSLNKFAERIVPMLLKNNPRAKEQIKWSSWLSWQEKQEVCEVIDSI